MRHNLHPVPPLYIEIKKIYRPLLTYCQEGSIIYTKGQRKSKSKEAKNMAMLSDSIEQFIKSLLEGYDQMIELQRNELADYFSCAPSQINYVLATRFSPEKGYYIESRRGGGGYIRLIRISTDKMEMINTLNEKYLKEDHISEKDALTMIGNMKELGLIDDKNRRMITSMISDKALKIPANIREKIRANMLKELLYSLEAEV